MRCWPRLRYAHVSEVVTVFGEKGGVQSRLRRLWSRRSERLPGERRAR